MKAFYHKKFGKGSALDIFGDVPKPVEPLSCGKLLIKVNAAALNPVDWKIREGQLNKIFKLSLPRIHGLDFCGEVVAVGPETKFKVGDKVFGMTRGFQGGSCAEFCVVDDEICAAAPDNLTSAQIASSPLVGLTTMMAFRNLGLQPGETAKEGYRLLILNGAGGVGSTAIQLAKNVYKVGFVATTASFANANLCKKLGADLTVDYKFDSEFKALDQVEKFDGIFDCVGDIKKTAKFIKKDGKATSIVEGVTAKALKEVVDGNKETTTFTGKMLLNHATGMLDYFGGSRGLRKEFAKHGATYTSTMVYADPNLLQNLQNALQSGALVPVIEKEFPFAEAKAAMAHLKSGRAKGKVVLNMNK